MKDTNVKTTLLLIDTLLTGFVNTGLMMVIFPLIQADPPSFWQTLLIALVSATGIVLLTRRVWIVPMIFGLFAVIGLLILATGQISGVLATIRDLLGETNTEAGADSLLLQVINYGISLTTTAVLFFFFRKLYFFSALLLVGAGMIVWLFFSGSDSFYVVVALILFVLGVGSAKSRGRAHAVALSEPIDRSRLYHTLTASAMIFVVLLFSFWMAPKTDGVWQSKWLVRTTRDVSSLLSLKSQRMPTDGLFNLSITGYQPLGNRLGGDITLDHTVVMNVYTNKRTLLAGVYYDTYDGRRWSDAHAQTQYRYGALILRGAQNRAFLQDLPVGGSNVQMLYERITSDGSYHVNTQLYGRSLFQTGRIQSLYETGFDSNRLSFNAQGELFIDGSARRGMKYRMDTIFIDRTRPRFDQNMLDLEQSIEPGRDPYYDFITGHYRQLPDTLPATVYDLAQSLTQNGLTPYQQARSIETWLSENGTYRLTPGTPPEDADFVAHFLQTRQGYCVYFASAMTVLARCSGLPARYVSGFALHRSPSALSDDHYVATNASAHAWSEVYFEGIGWVPFDPSGRYAQQFYDMTDLPVVDPVLTPDPSSAPENPNESDSTDSKDASGQFLLILGLIAAAAVGLALFSLARADYLLRDRCIYRKRFNARYQKSGDKLDALFQRSIKQLTLMGYPIQPAETINEYLLRIRQIPELRDVPTAWQSVIQMKYAFQEPSDDEVETLYLLCHQLEKRLRSDKGRRWYWFWRIILFR